LSILIVPSAFSNIYQDCNSTNINRKNNYLPQKEQLTSHKKNNYLSQKEQLPPTKRTTYPPQKEQLSPTKRTTTSHKKTTTYIDGSAILV
jgi:hypothetical protein